MALSNHDRAAHNSVPLLLSLTTLSLAIAVWFNAVSSHVREPYLDEVFHVGQVQQYCRGNYWHWDPKITTPPGLYLLSIIFYKITGRCDLDALRIINTFSLFAIFFFLLYTVPPVSPRSHQTSRSRNQKALSFIADCCPQQIHSALNVCLFPPLFFFCALYYTDVASTLSVLLFVRHFLKTNSRHPVTFLEACFSILLGLISLSFRQTNIFWVAVFPIALLVVVTVHDDIATTRPPDNLACISRAWSSGILFDAHMRDATLDDFCTACLSLAVLAVRTIFFPKKLLRIAHLVWPYVFLLVSFASLVFWNGGVVLGDKSNHVATLHLPQMLYLWAYTTFFSFPLTYPFLMQALLAVTAAIPVVALLEPLLIFSRHKLLPRPFVLIGFVVFFSTIVRFNTIVHPFTLADNRHFTFYVFRILLRHPAIRYLVVPVYVASAWSVLQALGASAQMFQVKEVETDDGDGPSSHRQESPESHKLLRLNDAPSGEGATVSFVLVWVTVSALQLITAPLVEPRYFILPWIMWRLRVPQAHPGASLMTRPTHKNWEQWWEKQQQKRKANVQNWAHWLYLVLWAEHDHRLYFETIWFFVINVVVGRIFLNWGFEWKQEPGKIQRFMW